jgi:hypothetical protein
VQTNSKALAPANGNSLAPTEEPKAIRLFEQSIERWMTLPIWDLGVVTDKDRSLIKEVYHLEVERLKGGQPDQIGKQLAIVRQVLNVEGPDEQSARVYLRLLSGVPADLLGTMTKNLLSTYRYNSFPKPADFLEAIKAATQERSDRKYKALIVQSRLSVYDLYYGEQKRPT